MYHATRLACEQLD